MWKYQDICMFIFRAVGLSSGLVQNKPWDTSIVFFCRCLRVVEVLSCGTLPQSHTGGYFLIESTQEAFSLRDFYLN